MSNDSTNLTEKQRQFIKNIVKPQERSQKCFLRDILNAIFYVNKSGCQWRMLPSGFTPWQTVYYYFRKTIADNNLGSGIGRGIFKA